MPLGLRYLEHKSLLVPIKWYEEFFPALFGFEVTEIEFDRENGVGLKVRDGKTFLILTQESQLATKEYYLRLITGNDQLKLYNKNVGENKEYREIYHAVKPKIKVDHQSAKYLRTTWYMNHFYGSRNTEKLLQRWVIEDGPTG